MKILYRIFAKKRVWMVMVMFMMIASTTYTLLDAFVFTKVYAVVEPVLEESNEVTGNVPEIEPATDMGESLDEAVETVVEPMITDSSYRDENISVSIETFDEKGVVYYVADIEVSDISYLKTALAENVYGKNVTETTSDLAENNDALFAINGDYYGFRDSGLVIRNGIMYRDEDGSESDEQYLIIDNDGNMGVIDRGEYTGDELIEMGVVQGFAFGPTLVENGEVVSNNASNKLSKDNPRTAIGQISELHYIVIVVDGRTDESDGMTLDDLAKEFIDRGATIAYNLDGGGSATMWFNGDVVNNPTNGKEAKEREVSDIIYLGY